MLRDPADALRRAAVISKIRESSGRKGYPRDGSAKNRPLVRLAATSRTRHLNVPPVADALWVS